MRQLPSASKSDERYPVVGAGNLNQPSPIPNLWSLAYARVERQKFGAVGGTAASSPPSTAKEFRSLPRQHPQANIENKLASGCAALSAGSVHSLTQVFGQPMPSEQLGEIKLPTKFGIVAAPTPERLWRRHTRRLAYLPKRLARCQLIEDAFP